MPSISTSQLSLISRQVIDHVNNSMLSDELLETQVAGIIVSELIRKPVGSATAKPEPATAKPETGTDKPELEKVEPRVPVPAEPLPPVPEPKVPEAPMSVSEPKPSTPIPEPTPEAKIPTETISVIHDQVVSGIMSHIAHNQKSDHRYELSRLDFGLICEEAGKPYGNTAVNAWISHPSFGAQNALNDAYHLVKSDYNNAYGITVEMHPISSNGHYHLLCIVPRI
jgi:hypothetical protein